MRFDSPQNHLGKAGIGLPKSEGFFLRNIAFPLLKRVLSWNMAMWFFEREGKRVLRLTQELGHNTLFERVLIPKVMGIEDNSRYYSPAMVLWHLIYVGETIQEGIITLNRGEELDFTVTIENFKPYVEISTEIVAQYKAFLQDYRRHIEQNVDNKNANSCHTHPWFGCLNPHGWLVLSAIHQMVHRRQIQSILKHGSKVT